METPLSNPPMPCPRCGGPRGRPFAGSALCPRCASERILAGALATEPGTSAAPFADPDFNGPQRIGPYSIISELGRGGMGVVYLAQHAQLGRIVALKAIPCGGAAASALEIRFLREARTIARLRHSNIVAVHDAGRAGAHAYFAMDYLDGGDLAQRLRQCRQFEARAAAELMHGVSSAIAYSHAEGVLHRDLKPSNILLEGEQARVADFGLAAQLEQGGDLTGPLGVLGTLHYSAPEALHGNAETGVAADIYSLGGILYELLAGRTPFAGASAAELPKLLADSEAPPLRLLAPQVPRDLETICRCCLRFDPATRYATAAALTEDLRRYLAGEPILARPASVAGQAWRWARRKPHLAAVWALSALLGVGSTATAVALNHARLELAAEASRAETALHAAHKSELLARSRLRAAKFAEARAVRSTTEPARRSAALAALAEAAGVGHGMDVRDEGTAALLLAELAPVQRWAIESTGPVDVTIDPTGRFAAIEELAGRGAPRVAVALRRWGATTPFARIEVANTTLASPVRFNPDGSRIVARFHDDSLRIWQTNDGAPCLTLSGLPLATTAREDKFLNSDLDFTSDGATLCLGRAPGGLSWRRVADGVEVAHSEGTVRFTTLRCSPVGSRVAACSTLLTNAHHQIFIYAQPGAAPERVFELPSAPLSIAWSPDGRQLAVTQNDNTVTTFDVTSGQVTHAFPSTVRDPRGVEFLGGDAFVAVSGGGTTIHVFNLSLRQVECEISSVGPSDLVRDATGKVFYTNSLEGVVTRWDARAPTGFRAFPLPHVVGYDISNDAGALDFSDDGRWVATAHGRFIAIRDLASGAFIGEIDGGGGEALQVSSVRFEAGGKSLLRSSTAAGLQRHAIEVTSDGRLVLGAGDPLDAEPGFIFTAETPDRRTAVLINRDTGDVKVLDLGGPKPRLLSRWHAPGVYNCSLNPDGTRVLLNCSGLGPDAAAMQLSVHDVADGHLIIHPAGAVSCDTAWSTDGATALTSSGQNETIIWDTRTWTRRATLVGKLGGNTTSFTLSPEGAYAVICSDAFIYIVNTSNGSLHATLHVPNAPGLATAVRFLPDRKRFAVLWPDGRLDLFSPEALETALAERKIR